jgi:hypothetical protein
MDNFEFDRVRKIMEALNWRWWDEDGGVIPEECDLRHSARKLLKDVCSDSTLAASGGFSALRRDDRIDLMFGVDSFSITDFYEGE